MLDVGARLSKLLTALLPWRRHDQVWQEHEAKREKTRRLEARTRVLRERQGYQ